MNSLVIKMGDNPIYEGLVEDLVPLAKVHGSAWRREINFEARVWKNHVRDLVFDIEDWVDQKPAMMDMGDQYHPEIEEEVKKFKAKIEQACELGARYNLLEQLPKTTRSSPVLPHERSRLLSLEERQRQGLLALEERRVLLALEDSTRHLEEHLKNGEMMLKVVSIFGKEGSGKTSLAKEIYAKLRGQFACRAFVSVGRRASLTTTLQNILRQVKPGANPQDCKTSQGLHNVRTELWEYLGTKRYFIVIDGLWSKRAWEVINSALADKNCGSRVLTTTCIIDVAKYCSMHSIEDLYAMKPLSEYNSKILLRRSIRVDKYHTWDIFDQFSSKVLEICAGFPLAILVAAGLLFRISEGLDGLIRQNSTSEGITMMLDMSCAELCLPLKSCFLYLGVFPEEYTIMKDRLIWLWRAEGFIPLWVTGECYFNELIIRRLIQPVFNYDDDEAVGCTVHGVIRDYIGSLSREENFVTVAADLGSGIFPCSSDTVRRLALDCCNDRDEARILASSTTHLLSMRSLTVFGNTEERDGRSALTVSDGSPVLPCFRHTRVLDLEDADNLRSHHLIGIEGLILLKYLGLRGTGMDELPGDIGKLEHLEMLDVRQTPMRNLPTSIVGLKRLIRLLVDDVVKVPCNIYEMEGLEEVSTVGPNCVTSFFPSGVYAPPRLRVLGISLAGPHGNLDVVHFLKTVTRCDYPLSISIFNLDRRFLKFLAGSLMHLSRHRKLEVTISSPIQRDDVYDITGIWSKYCGVTHLDMEITQLTEEAVSTLSWLPLLVVLKLVSAGKDDPSILRKSARPSRCIISREGDAFVRLEVLCFTSKLGGMELQFGSGAMPMLRRLGLCFSAWETLSRYGDLELGIQHLKGLRQVHATISCKDATVSEVEKAEAVIREQARQAGCTTTELRRELEDKMLPGERKSMGLLAKTANMFTSLF
uniref:Uncharacterized protein n=1 Tax=Avena sativa TaxID=4498 RepID=A0ACD5Z9G3_AVESA